VRLVASYLNIYSRHQPSIFVCVKTLDKETWPR
jgi:hypothetical protein